MADGYISQIKTPDNKTYLLKDKESIHKSDELLTTNSFAPVSLKGPYISKIDNAFYAADKRWTVTANGLNAAVLFDGSYESQTVIAAGNSATILMDFDPNHNNSAYFPGYPYGYILISFYYTSGPASITGRVYCNYSSHGIGWHDISFSPVSDNGSANIVYRSAHQGYYNISQLEITITAPSSNNTGITQIEMHLDRPSSDKTPFLSKYNAETLYYDLTAPKFIGALQGNANTATKFNSTRKIELTGAVTGSATTDGSSGWTISTTVNHNHDDRYKIASGVITLGSNTITPVTSVNGHVGNSVSVTAADLGLSKAMRFIGVATVAITDGSTTDPVISGYSTKTAGDVIIDKDSSREYVWSTTGKWELLGGDESYWVSSTNTAAKFWRGDNVWSDTISGGTLKITNNTITLEIGAQNSSWTHFTSNAAFYFNHQLNVVDGFKVYNTNTSLTNNNLTFAQGGGWSMSDSTWIRTVGSKSVYMNTGTFRNDGTTQLRTLQHVNANIAVDGSWTTGTTGTANSGDGNATQGALGTSILAIGNATARPAAGTAGGANNAKGYLYIYGAGSGYGELTYNDSMFASNKSIYLTNTANSGINNEIRGLMAANDYWRVAGGATASNAGYMEIATADDGTEPIYVRQYSGVFATLKHTATLLDASGNTEFPVQVTAPKFIGALQGNADSATNISGQTPTLAVSVESNEIKVIDLGNSSPVSGAAQRHAIDFRWYDSHWAIGNLRSGSSPSAGFGFSYSSDGGTTYSNLVTISTAGKITATGGFSGNLTGYVSGNALTADTFSSGTTVKLTGDTTGESASSTKGWSLTATTNKMSATPASTLNSQAQIDDFLEASKLKYGLFKTTDANNVGMASNDGMLISMSWGSTTYGAQLAFDDATAGVMKFRGKATNWGEWRTVAHNGNVSTGDSNGQVKIAGTNVSVKGLGSAAYTDSTTYAAAGHSHTLKIGNESLSVSTSTQTWKLKDIQAGPQYHVGDTGSCTYVLVTINSETSWMLAFTLRLYQGYRATDIQISGYNYGGNHWYNPKAVILGDTETGEKKVYFGYTGNYKLWVAVDGSSYTGADVFGVTNGYTQVDWENMMTITKVNSLPGTTQTTATIYRPWYRDETVSTAASANSVAWANVSGHPTKLSQFTNDSGYITSYTETDPTVPAWAKAASKPTYTASEVGAAPSSTVSCTTANIESALGIDFITHAGALNTNGWKTLGGRASGAKIAIAYNNNPASWNSGTYSASLVFGCNDTRGLLDLNYNSPTVTFGGSSVAGSDDNNPKWYFKLSGTSGQTYTFPSTSKTLAASDGSNASGSWGISITGTAAKLSDITTADAASSSATWRRVWFCYDNNTTGRPAYSDNFCYQTSTSILKVPHLQVTHASGGSNEINIKYSTTIDYWWGVGTGDVNHGMYDSKANDWIIFAGAANTWSFKGNATTATTATNLSAAPTIVAGGTSTINLSANTAYTLTVGGKSVIFKTPADNNTATATDNILDGSNSGTAITYAPYTAQQAKLSFDTSTTAPTRTDRLNLNGFLYATKYNVAGHVTLQYNTTDQSLDFIF